MFDDERNGRMDGQTSSYSELHWNAENHLKIAILRSMRISISCFLVIVILEADGASSAIITAVDVAFWVGLDPFGEEKNFVREAFRGGREVARRSRVGVGPRPPSWSTGCMHHGVRDDVGVDPRWVCGEVHECGGGIDAA
ncbi:hypothetical protein [Dokdonella sp.]|uniref:hypothetical protein n=1 Tax=Dokdonella sp. TaxID=2291710 RepID=UPI0025C3A6CC|nr:hypothetical protein [Dokdonella sp.]MBX3690703.1 hypothetical protein [Dokdonella sp.]MCW5567909.1 hypothetical protein [Dokdonella sp.]